MTVAAKESWRETKNGEESSKPLPQNQYRKVQQRKMWQKYRKVKKRLL